MAQGRISGSDEIGLDGARDLLAADVAASSYQSVADRVGISKPTLYNFLNGVSVPKGERRRRVLEYARRRAAEQAGQERSGSFHLEPSPPDAERPASQDWGQGALFAVEEMAITLARITRTARIRMGEVPDGTLLEAPAAAPLAATPAAAGARPAPPAAEAREAQRVRELERQLQRAAAREQELEAAVRAAARARQTATGAADAPAPPARQQRRASGE